jgi:hypothetical protein
MRNPKNLSGHILPTSGAMLGVCMTVISIVKLTQTNRGIAYWVDDLLALDALIFLASSIFSYLSIRSNSKKVYFEDIADKFFMLALLCMGAAVLLLTYEIV